MPKLTKQTLKDALHYNPDTGAFTHRFFSSAPPSAQSAMCRINQSGQMFIKIEGVWYSARRLAWLYMTGVLPHFNLYSVSRDKGNYRWANITDESAHGHRPVQKSHPGNKSGCVGVCYDKKTDRWVASIMKHRVRHHLGRFEDVDDAIAARKAAEAETMFM